MKRSSGSIAFWMVSSALLICACSSKAKSDKAVPAEVGQPKTEVKASEVVLAGDIGHKDPACRACRATYCTKYDGVVDLVATCFGNSDPKFVQECVAAMNCAHSKKCGSTVEGAMECFCGTSDVPTCLKPGGPNGPCQSEWLAAARTTSVTELSERFGDLSFPAGIANYFVSCDRDYCKMCRPQAK